MRPILKISRLTNLQDARYAAAVGFDLVSFSLERGAFEKLPLTSVWNIVNWLDGPAVVLEMNVASLEEINDLSFDPAYLAFPAEEWDEMLWNYAEKLILRVSGSSPSKSLEQLLARIPGDQLMLEVQLTHANEVDNWQAYLDRTLLCFPSLEEARVYLESHPESGPYGISIGKEALDEEGLLDYESLDDLVAMYSDVHL
ncbi:MAG: hypothetical protein AAGI38_06440 [Bacteroidota bacterium]